MKKLRIVLLPAALILIGAAAAFATNATKNTDDDLVTGYYFDKSASPIKCIQTDKMCSTSGDNVCTWSDGQKSHNLSTKINNTQCGDPLFERQDN
jgi:hypothetical protein